MFWLLSCAVPEYSTEIELNPESIEFPWVSYRDVPPESVEVGVRNRGLGPVYLTLVGLQGEGLGNLTVVGEWEDAIVPVGQSKSFRVAISRVYEEWEHGEYDVDVVVEATAAYGGGMGTPYDHSDTTDEYALPILVKIDCDLDDDGEESSVCGGEDSDDKL